MFGRQSKPSRVYAYGAKRPRQGLDRVLEQLRLARQYRNALVECELDRRQQVDEAVREHFPRLAAIDDRLAELDTAIEERQAAIRAANSAQRSRAPTPEERAAVKALKDERKALLAERKALRKEAFADAGLRAALDGIDARDLQRRKELRAASGLHWGTYSTVEQGLSGIRSGPPPRFVGSRWQGKLAVQIQTRPGRTRTWADLCAGNLLPEASVEVLPLPAGATPGGRRSKRPVCLLHFRVGGGRRDGYQYAIVPFTLHRPIPADAEIAWIYLVPDRVASVTHWSVQFVLARSEWPRADTIEAHGACAVHLGAGLRLEDDSRRVAYVLGDDGHREELTLPPELLSRWERSETLQATRDKNFELEKAALSKWLAVEDVPDWLRDATATLGQWRSQARLASLVRRWSEQRFGGDGVMFERLQAWAKQDRHLWDWQEHNRRRADRIRREAYRRFVARLRWRYERVVVDDADYRAILRRPEAEDATEPERMNNRKIARIAAPGTLRELLRQGHPSITVASAVNITRTCTHCGHVEDREIEDRIAVCPACQASEDRDLRAARNLLASAQVVPE